MNNIHHYFRYNDTFNDDFECIIFTYINTDNRICIYRYRFNSIHLYKFISDSSLISDIRSKNICKKIHRKYIAIVKGANG